MILLKGCILLPSAESVELSTLAGMSLLESLPLRSDGLRHTSDMNRNLGHAFRQGSRVCVTSRTSTDDEEVEMFLTRWRLVLRATVVLSIWKRLIFYRHEM